MIGSSQDGLAKWQAELLKPALEEYSQYCVEVRSFGFTRTIRDMPNDFADSFMCPFDIRSLFTNVSLDEAVNICPDSLFCSGNMSAFSKEILVELMNFATGPVEFSFSNYEQKG